jgi:hypothetical protein
MAEYLVDRRAFNGNETLETMELVILNAITLCNDMARGFADRDEDNVWPLPNVWLGTSVEDQAAADERIPHLLRCPAAVRFLSCEPLLSRVEIPEVSWQVCRCGSAQSHAGACRACKSRVSKRAIHWVIVGGESGPRARPCDIHWIRMIGHQCRRAGVPLFVKQIGADPVVKVGNHCRVESMRGVASYERRITDRKGSDPSEWPEDLRVREFPT